ncbi:uncharacterized protein DSM5745_08871 [Aspergillus mulundensis]|uniref:Uncharacterized protein n=1 Tax=Aspergillus mulundensis TaxID=1810919 RepID=A0A3D8R5A5_9EURO|nr:hypothetical protein DSM5745_08871 [Aspergillus mulundensis]RDW69111.1 hypothetical protein DSM5745_08871 [Aspergillus mulundensis]
MSAELKRPTDVEVAADAGQILQKAQIPNILMGWTVMRLYTGPCNFRLGDITFVIPDALLDAARDALSDAARGVHTEDEKYWTPCLTTRKTPQKPWLPQTQKYMPGSGDKLSRHPNPAHHFHINYYIAVYLVPQSENLWWLPETSMQPGLPDPNLNPYVTLSTDSSLPFPDHWRDLFPLRVLKTGTFIEAILHLWMRDNRRQHETDLWMFWDGLAGSLQHGPASQVHLRDGFQRAWDFCRGEFDHLYQKAIKRGIDVDCHFHLIGLIQLREQLRKDGRFPLELKEVGLPDTRWLDGL